MENARSARRRSSSFQSTLRCHLRYLWNSFRGNQRQISVIHLQRQHRERSGKHAAALIAPAGRGVPRAGKRALLSLKCDQRVARARVPAFPVVILELDEGEGAVIPAVEVGGARVEGLAPEECRDFLNVLRLGLKTEQHARVYELGCHCRRGAVVGLISAERAAAALGAGRGITKGRADRFRRDLETDLLGGVERHDLPAEDAGVAEIAGGIAPSAGAGVLRFNDKLRSL